MFIIFLFKAQLQAWSISHKYQEVPEATVRIKELIWTLDLSFKAVMYSEFGFMVKEMVIAEVCFLKLQNHFWNVFIEIFVGAVHENEWTCSTALSQDDSTEFVYWCHWCRGQCCYSFVHDIVTEIIRSTVTICRTIRASQVTISVHYSKNFSERLVKFLVIWQIRCHKKQEHKSTSDILGYKSAK